MTKKFTLIVLLACVVMVGQVHAELITNGGFETHTGTQDDGTTDSFTGWSVYHPGGNGYTDSSATVHSGSAAVKIHNGTVSDTAEGIYQDIAVSPSTNWTMRFWQKGDCGHGYYYVYDNTHSSYIVSATAFDPTGTYTEIVRIITVPAGCTSIEFGVEVSSYVGGSTANKDLYVDDASLVLKPIETINVASGWSWADIVTAVGSTFTGDTVVIPPGTGHATSTINVNGITLRGATTVDATAGTADDQTILLDDITADWDPIFSISNGRCSGITFGPGTRNNSSLGSLVVIGGATPRLDHCHLLGPYRLACVFVYTTYGVIDHNLFTFDPTSPLQPESIHIRMPNWNGDSSYGDGSFADFPWFGTEKFVFIEDNYFKNTSGLPLMSSLDADYGARMVIRHNQGYDWQVQNHGTENRIRGTRCAEIYNNDFHFTTSTALGGIRTGAYLYHDNTFAGTEVAGPAFNYLRAGFYFDDATGFLGASGDSPWDVNATESDGTHVDGHSPYLFASGTCESGSNETTIVDSTKNWTPNYWGGYTVKRVSDNHIAMILDNTATTLTVLYFCGGYGCTPTWTAGDQYEIHKVLVALDQPGRGKGDLITGDGTPALNNVTGTGSVQAYVNNPALGAWPHQALEPCYSWNNFYTGGIAKGFTRNLPPSVIEGRDYYNDSSSAAVVAKYTAALNGSDYTGPYTYPHPLVVTDTPTITPRTRKHVRSRPPTL